MGMSFARHMKDLERLRRFHNKEKTVLISVLTLAREQLEDIALIKKIDQALAIVPPPTFKKPKPYDPYYLHRPVQEELCLRYLE